MPKGVKTRVNPYLKDENGLTEMQCKFVHLLTDETSESFLNPIKACELSGYKSGSSAKDKKQIAARLLTTKTILKHLLSVTHKNKVIAELRQETAKERIWRELELALEECKTVNDMTNRLRVIDMMGKFHQLWSDKNGVSTEVSRQLSDSYLKELRELSKLSMSGSVIDAELSDQPAATRLLQAQSGVVSSPCDIQDVGDDVDSAVNSSAIQVLNDTQAIDDKEVM